MFFKISATICCYLSLPDFAEFSLISLVLFLLRQSSFSSSVTVCVLFSRRCGGTSSVYLIQEKETSKLYALKQVPKWEQYTDVVQEQAILRTMAALLDGASSFLLLVGIWSDSKYHYLLTPWCGGKDLLSLLVNRQKFEVDQVVAVKTLHQLNTIHCDIQPANIFLTKEGNMVLGDSGLAKRFSPSLMSGGLGLPSVRIS
ncbi:kinase-like domain-containing protein [Mycena rosella]|uniref:non-specific serine/threonine protein kinase n=1 Tax=Mycena rosella TaxID=1033263 RepID=A0AAD7DAS9_MYCRO|nr:kinase-like domain-containing protein [Mycena rosella]